MTIIAAGVSPAAVCPPPNLNYVKPIDNLVERYRYNHDDRDERIIAFYIFQETLASERNLTPRPLGALIRCHATVPLPKPVIHLCSGTDLSEIRYGHVGDVTCADIDTLDESAVRPTRINYQKIRPIDGGIVVLNDNKQYASASLIYALGQICQSYEHLINLFTSMRMYLVGGGKFTITFMDMDLLEATNVTFLGDTLREYDQYLFNANIRVSSTRLGIVETALTSVSVIKAATQAGYELYAGPYILNTTPYTKAFATLVFAAPLPAEPSELSPKNVLRKNLRESFPISTVLE
jgi:hypothetical protein